MTERIKDTLAKDAGRHTTAQALKAMRECTDIARTRDFIAAVGEQVTIKELAKVFAEEIRDPTSRKRKDFVALYMEMVARTDRTDGAVTEDDASKLADEQIEEMLAQYGYGTCPKCGYCRATDDGRTELHGTDERGEGEAPVGVAGAEQGVG